MKKQPHIWKVSVALLSLLITASLPASGQDRHCGNWEGMFMKDFKTIIHLDYKEDEGYTGKILMFDEEGFQIQDDPISKIEIQDLNLSFYIEDKETVFNGVFNSDLTELSGVFIFPDQSEHPLKVSKAGDG
jgi:hypothetical protein